MEIDEVLDKTADELMVSGWVQGNYRKLDGRMCVEGAACHVTSNGRYHIYDSTYVPVITVDALLFLMEQVDAGLEDDDKWGGDWTAWNDDDEREKDEVIDGLRIAAKAYREQTQTGLTSDNKEENK